MIFFTNNELHKDFGLQVDNSLNPPDEKEFQARNEKMMQWREANLKTGVKAGTSSSNNAVTHVDTTRPTSPGPPSQVHRFQAAVQAATTGPQASSSATDMDDTNWPKLGASKAGTVASTTSKASTTSTSSSWKNALVSTKPTASGQRSHQSQAATTGPGPATGVDSNWPRLGASPGQSNTGPKAGTVASRASTSGKKGAVTHVTTKPAGQNADSQDQAATTNVQAWSKAVSRPVGTQAGQLQAGTVQAPGNIAMTPRPGTTPNTRDDDPNAPASFSDPILEPKPKSIHYGFGHNLREEGAKKEDHDQKKK